MSNDPRPPEDSTERSPLDRVSDERLAALARYLTYTIAFVVVAFLSAILYFLVSGVLDPPAPRTALEAKFKVLEVAVKKNSGSGRVWADYITVNSAMKRYSAARGAWQDARTVLAEAPDELQKAELAWAESLLSQLRFEEAVEQADLVLDSDAEALKALGEKKKQAAEMGFVETGALAPAWAVKANALVGVERWKDAVEAYTQVLALTPRDSNILAARGVAHLNSGDKESARADFEEALRFIPDNETALRFLEEMGEE